MRGEGAQVALHLHTLGFLTKYLLTAANKVCSALDKTAHTGQQNGFTLFSLLQNPFFNPNFKFLP